MLTVFSLSTVGMPEEGFKGERRRSFLEPPPPAPANQNVTDPHLPFHRHRAPGTLRTREL